MGRLKTGERAAPMLLHFIVQGRFQASLGKASSHIADRCLAHI
jgi:hypothetical protein